MKNKPKVRRKKPVIKNESVLNTDKNDVVSLSSDSNMMVQNDAKDEFGINFVHDISWDDRTLSVPYRSPDMVNAGQQLISEWHDYIDKNYANRYPRACKLIHYMLDHIWDYELVNNLDKNDPLPLVNDWYGQSCFYGLRFKMVYLDECEDVTDEIFDTFFEAIVNKDITIIPIASTYFYEVYLAKHSDSFSPADANTLTYIKMAQMPYVFQCILVPDSKTYKYMASLSDSDVIKNLLMEVMVIRKNRWYDSECYDRGGASQYTYTVGNVLRTNFSYLVQQWYDKKMSFFDDAAVQLWSKRPCSSVVTNAISDDLCNSGTRVVMEQVDRIEGSEVRTDYVMNVVDHLRVRSFDTYRHYCIGLSDLASDCDDSLSMSEIKRLFSDFNGCFIAVKLLYPAELSVLAASDPIQFDYYEERFGYLGAKFESVINDADNVARYNSHIEFDHLSSMFSGTMNCDESCGGNSWYYKFFARSDKFCFYVDGDNEMLRFIKPVIIPAINYDDPDVYNHNTSQFGFFDTTAVDIFFDKLLLSVVGNPDSVLDIFNISDRDAARYVDLYLENISNIGLVCKDESYLPKPTYCVMGYAFGSPFYYFRVNNGKKNEVKLHNNKIYNFSDPKYYDYHLGQDITSESSADAKKMLSAFHYYDRFMNPDGTMYIPIERYIALCGDSWGCHKKHYSYNYLKNEHKIYDDFEIKMNKMSDRSSENKKVERDLLLRTGWFFNICCMKACDRTISAIRADAVATKDHKRSSASKKYHSRELEIIDGHRKSASRMQALFGGEFNIDFDDFYNYVKARVIGHDSEVKKACFYVWTYFRSLAYDDVVVKSNFIIAGTSGCGKTEFMRAVKSYLKEHNIVSIPVAKIDTTSATARGYRGDDIEDLVSDVIIKSRDSEGAAIIFLDEIDKTISSAKNKRGGYEYFDSGVQYSLLTIMEGSDLHVRSASGKDIILNSTNTLFVGLGSFDFVRKHRELVANSSSVGFTSDIEAGNIAYNTYIERKDVLDQGAHAELLGRFTDIINFGTLSDDSLKRILYKNIDDRYTWRESMPVKKINIKPDAEKKFIELGKDKFGVRLMVSELVRTVDNCLVDIATKNYDDISSITIVDIDKTKVNCRKKNKKDADDFCK